MGIEPSKGPFKVVSKPSKRCHRLACPSYISKDRYDKYLDKPLNQSANVEPVCDGENEEV